MNLQVSRTSGKQYNPVFLSILEDIQGGVTVKTDRIPSGTKLLFPGTPLNADTTSAGLYNVVKTMKLKRTLGTAALVTIYVYSSDLPNKPSHDFIAGEYIMEDGRGTSVTIASITKGTLTNGVGTDIIYLTAGSGGLHSTAITGTVIQEAAAGSLATGAVPLYLANALMRDTAEVRDCDGTLLHNVIVGTVIRGSVNESILPYAMPTEAVKTPLTSRIRFE